MSKSEIQSWIVSSASRPESPNEQGEYDDGDDSNGDQSYRTKGTWQRDRVLANWPRSMEYAKVVLFGGGSRVGKTEGRIRFLNDELGSLAKHGDLNISQVMDVFRLLVQTYPRFSDTLSRDAVENVCMELIRRDELRGAVVEDGGEVESDGEARMGVAEQIVGWMASEVGGLIKRGSADTYAPSDLFVLLSWACGIYTICSSSALPDSPSASLWPSLARCLALLLDMIEGSQRAKQALKHGALVRVRRALRSAPDRITDVLTTLISQADSSPTSALRVIPLLGTAISVLIRLKNVETPLAERLPGPLKDGIIKLYTSTIIMAKSHVPLHVLEPLHDFITTFISIEEFKTAILPTFEKALIRSPEYSLAVAISFFQSYPNPLDVPSFERLTNQLISTSKSTNPQTRTSSITLFKGLIHPPHAAISSSGQTETTNGPQQNEAQHLLPTALTLLLSLPRTSKTSGPDHRLALYSMISSIPPLASASSSFSLDLLKETTPLLAKEPHEGCVAVLARALAPHIQEVLLASGEIPAETTNLIVKELGSAKVAVRRAYAVTVGNVFYGDGTSGRERKHDNSAEANGHINVLEKEGGLRFAKALVQGLEGCLKSVAANPLGGASSTAGSPVEGYVAVAVLLGAFVRGGRGAFDDIIGKNPAIASIVSSGPKTSFLLWDKVYQKAVDEEEEMWLLRAAEEVREYSKAELGKSEILRSQLGILFIHLGANSSSSNTRRNVLKALQRSTAAAPELTSDIIRDALITFVARGVPKPIVPAQPQPGTSGEEQGGGGVPWNRHARLASILSSSVPTANAVDVDVAVREGVIAKLIILGHHELICGHSRQTWIDLTQRAGADPRELVNRNLDELMKYVLEATATDSKFGFTAAAYSAVTTLAFISPTNVLPRIVDQLKVDLDPVVLNSLTDIDIGMWNTPEGTTFIDVVGSAKGEAKTMKGKDAAITKWEDDIRKSLANKKGSSTRPTLTKGQQALLNAQLEKEAAVRQRVVGIQENLIRGLNLVKSLVGADVEEFQGYVSVVAEVLLEGALKKGVILAKEEAFDTYLELAKCCSSRLEASRRWIGIATLRILAVDAVAEELQAESLNSLVIRVLYRLRFLSEQAVFDAATFSYAFPLLGQVLLQGGISAEDEDEKLEQITLALDIIKFHAGDFANVSFPRADTLKHLIHVVRHQPKLSKAASSILVDVGEAIHSTATKEEISALLKATLSQEVYVRNSCLQALQPFDLTDLDWSPELWMVNHDEDEQNARLAQHIWEDNGLDVPESYLVELQGYLGHENAYVRSAAAAAIAESVQYWPQTVQNTANSLQEYYREKAKILAPEFDEYGMVLAQSLDRSDPWPTRQAIARVFELTAPSITPAEVIPFFKFLIRDEALGDRVPDVRRAMLAAGTTIIDLHGASCLAELISIFEGHLGQPSEATETSDQIKEAVVILFGRVARHLESTDPRIPVVIDRLVEALKTPAEQVQIAVSDCLSPLVKLMKPKLAELVDKLFEDLFNAPKYAARRGAAYGLAGVLKGTGVNGLKEFKVIARLRAAAEDKKHFEPRQGVMFAFETLSNTLGRLFEPYITFALPLLLTSFGDANADVREATQDASKVIMGNLSAYGVKLILPSLLEGLDEKQWRSKKGSIELLGMMAYCSPRQLSVSLPIVIPRLTGVLTDSHAQVRTSANKSLKQFGEVISNPEIQSLVPVLLKALVDPAKTPNALTSLLKTSFMHYIDQSSLALVVPILERGLRERGADTKKRAAQIVGNLASLTDSKDFVPYLPKLLPMVHLVLVDPVPEARATAAKALGTLVERLGEVHFPDLVPGLLRTLKTDTSGVDRQGAAQGLSEVLSGLGMERLEGLLPDILANAQSPRPTVREGFMSLLVYLPATFGTRFQPHLPKIIAPILGGLSDTEEYVRDAAMRAGRMVVTNYSNKAIDLLLPELEQGMFDPGWRIRHASITLVGELLFKVSGISGKTSELEEEDTTAEAATAESSRKALVEVLGVDRRDRILAALYLIRQDGVVVVRQASIQIWKALVSNTPRTVREILPSLMNQIIILISGDEFEQEETAARTISELCRKFGERILNEIMPILKNKSTSPDARTREGVCLVLCDVLENSTETQLEDHEDDIITMVRVSLVDDEANVRAAAAKAFDILQEHVGVKAIDQTIPTLLEALRQPGKGSGTALQALQEVMTVRATTVFPVLIPTLTAIPMSVFNARALAALVTVAGAALSKRVSAILTALVKVSEGDPDEELQSAVEEATTALLESVDDSEGLNTLMMLLIGWAKSDSVQRRTSAYKLFATFCEVSELDASLYRVDWIRQIITSFEDPEVSVHTAAWNALDIFVKSLPKDELESLVVPLRRSIESTGAPGLTVPGFSLPKGVAPTVPVIIAGLTTGSNEQREQAAYAIGDLVERTEESAIKPYVVPFTGPLIRVATQATTYPPAVKTAILSALTSMLVRIPVFVKPFFPQLQRTFVKSTSDPSSIVVRNKAAQALGVLMKNQPRVDPVITELIAGAKANEEAIATSMINALANVLRSAGQQVGDAAKEACVELVTEAFASGGHDEHYAQAVGALVVALSQFPHLLRGVVQSHLVGGTSVSMMASNVILAVVTPDEDVEEPQRNLFQKLSVIPEVTKKIQESVASDKPPIARPAREARDLLRDLDDS